MLRRKRSREQQLIVPEPVAKLTAVLNDMWSAYAIERHRGAEPDAALDNCLARLLPGPDGGEVRAFLAGDLDSKFGLEGDRGGRGMRIEILRNAEAGYQQARSSLEGSTEAT